MIPSIRSRRFVQVAVPMLCLAVGLPGAALESTATAPKKIREPAVAGPFYPKDPAELARAIDACLAAAKTAAPEGELKALICPHAGYAASGLVAGSAFHLLKAHAYDTVVVLGPSHTAELSAASVTNADLYRTALGDVPISPKARQLAQLRPFALEPPCLVQRPEWWAQSSRSVPDKETADTWEHSVEVEIPFLQRTLKTFELISVVCGEFDEEKAARALIQILDDRTLIIASSDLSHYYSYRRAKELDQRCIEAICRLDIDTMESQEACGRVPILVLMHVARLKGWQVRLLDCRNSGDTTGDLTRGVVGYAAIAFYVPAAGSTTKPATGPIATPIAAPALAPAAAPAAAQFTAADRRYLLDLARKSLRKAAATGQIPEVSAERLDKKFTADKGCFVTLTRRGELRGCIGYILPQGPLYRAVIENARNAAIHDLRFPAVSPDEVDGLEIEISVLTEPQPLAFSSPEDLLRKLQPLQDGVVLQIDDDHRATYLPQVWEHIPDKVDFLDSLAEKAGCLPSAWRRPGTAVSIYHVESFKESDKEITNVH